MTRSRRLLVALALGAAFQMGAAHAQDAAAGKTVFAQCSICHQIGAGAQNMIGPVLTGVVGRKAATYPGFDYSDALKAANLTWTDDNLKKWLKDPSALVPGTKMTFPGLPNETDIDNVIAYLKTEK
jgi:cytochrome c